MTFSTTQAPLDIAGILLDANTPRDAASRTLFYLQGHTRAKSVSLWTEDVDRGIALALCIDGDEDTLAGARALFTGKSAGARTLRGEDSILVLATGSDDAWAYVDGIDPNAIDADQVASGAGVAIKVLRRGRQGGGIGAGFRDVKREELIATLRIHEWNIARVARVKGVTRKTIYDWLEKYKIPRERVAKG